MSRLVDFDPADEGVIVNRIVQLVHMSIDHEFGSEAPPAPRKFAQTEFAADEPTVNQPLPLNLSDSDYNSDRNQISQTIFEKPEKKWIFVLICVIGLVGVYLWFIFN